MIQQMT